MDIVGCNHEVSLDWTFRMACSLGWKLMLAVGRSSVGGAFITGQSRGSRTPIGSKHAIGGVARGIHNRNLWAIFNRF